MKRILFLLLVVSFNWMDAAAQGNYEGDSLYKYILKPVISDEVAGLIRHYTLTDQNVIDFGKGKMNKELGIATFSTVEGVTRINLYGYDPTTNEDGKKVFPYKLPLGMKWGMTETEVIAKLDGMTVNQSHRLVIIYYRPGVNFEYYFGTQTGRLRMITVMVSWSKFDKGAVIYATERTLSKQANSETKPNPQNVQTSQIKNSNQSSVTPVDFCSAIKQLITDATNSFAAQKKIKEISPTRWQMENIIQGALFSEILVTTDYSKKQQYRYSARVKDNMPNTTPVNTAMEELKNKITNCLPGYKMRELGLNAFTDDPQSERHFIWEKAASSAKISLQKKVSAADKASLFIDVSLN